MSYTVVPSDELALPIDDVRATIDRSFQTWMNVTCGEPGEPGVPLPITFGQTEEVGLCDLPEYNRFGPNANTIAFVSDWSSRGKDYKDNAYGVTFVWFNPDTGEILDADIQVNIGFEPLDICGERCDGAFVDLENVVTHEVGHFLGLSHSNIPEATMYREALVAEVAKRDLQSDDIEGACEIYANESSMMCEEQAFAPRRGFTAECSEPMESSSCALRQGSARRGDLAACFIALIGLFLVKRRRLVPAAAALLLLLGPSEAWAFCRLTTAAPSPLAQCSTEGEGLEWTRSCVSYTVVPSEGSELDLDEVRNAIDDSFAAWTTVDCGDGALPLELAQTEVLGSCRTAEYNQRASNANLIAFLDEWPGDELPLDAFALTLVWHSPTSGKIFDADMLLNETLAPFALCDASCSAGVSDLRNVVTHEAGHFLGLGHSNVDGATMSVTALLGETDKRTLEDDDREGICAVYGSRDRSSCDVSDYAPDRGFSPKCAADGPECADAGASDVCQPPEDSPSKAGGGGGCAVRAGVQGRGAAAAGGLFALIALALVAAVRRRARFIRRAGAE